MSDGPQTVFISYASPDRDRVVPYADALQRAGFDIWIDCKRLRPGQDWNFEIRRALEKAVIVIVFFSMNSVDRRGYVQREIKVSLDQATERLAEDIYIIPVILDDEVAIPDQVRHLQCVKASDADHLSSIEEAIRFQLQTIGTQTQATQDRAEIKWTETKFRESWPGLPGYHVEYNLLQFPQQSTQRSRISQLASGENSLSW